MAIGNVTSCDCTGDVTNCEFTSTVTNCECAGDDVTSGVPFWLKKGKRRRNVNRPRIWPIKAVEIRLASMGVDVSKPRFILRKTLQKSDYDICEGRLLLTSKMVQPSPLIGMLTDAERALITVKSGLEVRVFDWLCREYSMAFKFLASNKAYRLIKGWSRFLRENSAKIKVGDDIVIWGMRIKKEDGNSEMGLVLMHYANDYEEDQKQEPKTDKRQLHESTEDELIVAQALLELAEIRHFPN